ncbi:M48 family peptidase [Bradyrhizobium sp. CCBAU 21365]|uniref:M48 family metallopeptidase n=1 Tax=Bradyrhizobium sp. CCBAU 21365 TaxID=1325083 RepID=UPI00188CB453|nr:SprT family zinc-dependent metalloprotease [Bradyrhizobium sp. CCBAU 21365]QOZ20827.1 M48 family peptidase [Bradyrhizobium sp. CCBAU 21365]
MTVVFAHSLNFGGEVVSFSIERTSRRKTVAISVGYDGVRVLAPNDLDDDRIIKIVRNRGPWLLRKQAGYRELGAAPIVHEFVSGETFYYLGRPYRMRRVTNRSAVATEVAARGAHLIASSQPNAEVEDVRIGLRRWYRQKAIVHFAECARRMAERLGVETPSILVVDQSKRWGSCDAKGRVRLNWRLVMAPKSLIEYVIAHEVCHILERNHSRRFWRSLEIIMPDYEERVRRLSRKGHLFSF